MATKIIVLFLMLSYSTKPSTKIWPLPYVEFNFEDLNSEQPKLQQVVVSKTFQICAIKHGCTNEPMETSLIVLKSGHKRLVISDS